MTRLLMGAIGLLGVVIAAAALGLPSAGAQEPDTAFDVSIEPSCGRGLGTVTTLLTNTTSTPLVATVEVGSILRNVLVDAGQSETLAVSGRPNGPISVLVNGVAAGDVTIDCDGQLVDRSDQLGATQLVSWGAGFEGAIAYLSSQHKATRSTNPEEPSECTLDGGTVWFRVVSPASSVDIEVRPESRVSVYRSDVAAPGFGDLAPVICLEESTTTTIDTTPGEILIFQVSGSDHPVALLRAERGLPDGIEVVNFASRCIPSGGVIEMSIRNTTDSDAQVVLQAFGPGLGEPERVVAVAAGSTADALVSSRSDGRYELGMNGINSGIPLWVGCAATAANDTIATATEIEFTDRTAKLEIGPGSYSYSDEEMARFGIDWSPCGFTSDTGSAWFTFVADGERLSVHGSDDQNVGLWRSNVSNPVTIDDLDEVVCSDAERLGPLDLVPGERYWLSSASDFLDLSLTLASGPANDDLADALVLDELKVLDARGAGPEPGDPMDCGYQRSVWFTWTADSERLDARSIAGMTWQSPPEDVGFGRGPQPLTYSVWSADIESPSFADLALVGCSGDYGPANVAEVDLTIGRTYWIRVGLDEPAMLAIDPSGSYVEVGVDVICPAGGSGVVEWTMTNPYSQPVDLIVRLDERNSTILRSVSIGANSTESLRVSGRSDGTYSTTVVGAPVQILGAEAPGLFAPVDVACGARVEPIEVAGSCLAGRGRIDVYLAGVDSSASAGVMVVGTGTLIQRHLYAAEGRTDRATITGRRNGTYIVEVDPSDRRATQSFEVVIDCG